jgi:hypothetical protein
VDEWGNGERELLEKGVGSVIVHTVVRSCLDVVFGQSFVV